jgi:hypothetical protein
MTHLVSDDPNPSHVDGQRIAKWLLWPISASLLSLAILASAKAGCGPTDERDTAVLGAAMVTGLATAFTLWRPLRAWRALAASLAATVAVAGGLVVLGVLLWVHDCAN